jgi:FixJ family two-component response regulator
MPNTTTHIIVGVDDDRRIRESLESLFESAGFASFVFHSAEELLRSGKLLTAGCLITDIRMPGMDGIELQQRIRLDRPYLPLIFLSGHLNDEIRRRAIAGGAFAVIGKPFDPEKLLETIHRAVDERRGD